MGTQEKNSFDKTDLIIRLLLLIMLLCTAGIAIMLVMGFRQHIW